MINLLSGDTVKKIIQEIIGQSEVTRRSLSLRRHKVYKDGGKDFLLESIRREFSEEAVKEMRLAPINLLKKMVNKKSSIYKKSPIRRTKSKTDQSLIDFYVRKLKVNQLFQKFNRYYTLDSNAVCYTIPRVTPEGYSCLHSRVVPAYLYSIVPNPFDRSEIDAYVFNTFNEAGRIFQTHDVPSATGREGFDREPGSQTRGELVASNEDIDDLTRQYVFWSKDHHITTTNDGDFLQMDPENGEDQFMNKLGRMPITNLTKDRDNEPWAIQGEDMIDLTLAIQSGWTDLLTIAKHQGFSILTVIAEEAPTQLTVGLNRAIWLKANKDGPTPSLDYKSSSANLGANKELLMELLGLLLSTNDMNPKSVGGAMTAQNFTSGFHALIEMADTIEAREEDKPRLMDAELDFWDVVSKWHNMLYELGASQQGSLDPDAYILGKFSDEFEVEILYPEMKPIESEKERIDAVKMLRDMGLMTKIQAMKKLNPDMSEEQVKDALKEIDEEKKASMEAMSEMMGTSPGQPPKPADDQKKPPTSTPADDENEAKE